MLPCLRSTQPWRRCPADVFSLGFSLGWNRSYLSDQNLGCQTDYLRPLWWCRGSSAATNRPTFPFPIVVSHGLIYQCSPGPYILFFFPSRLSGGDMMQLGPFGYHLCASNGLAHVSVQDLNLSCLLETFAAERNACLVWDRKDLGTWGPSTWKPSLTSPATSPPSPGWAVVFCRCRCCVMVSYPCSRHVLC